MAAEQERLEGTEAILEALRYGGGFFGGSEPKPERWGWDPSGPTLWILERDEEQNRMRTKIAVG